MISATLTFNELDTDELEMKLSFSGEEFNPDNISHLAAVKAAQMIGQIIDQASEEDKNESSK